MLFRATLIGVSFFVSFLNCAMAQMSFYDTIRIPEVTIYSTYRQLHSIGTNIVRVDTLKIRTFEGRNLSDLLQSTGVNIRTYGIGGLATVALRGGGSSHTAVVWNGINLQSPMNGGVNLSQLPVSLFNFNNVSVQQGGSGTIYGSGAVSGIVLLESGKLLMQPNGFSAGLLYGDGNTRGVSLGAKVGGSKRALSVRYTGNWADNDFEFINIYRYGSPRERITNAQSRFNGVMADAALLLTHQLSWNVAGWLTHNDKNLQTLMSSTQPSQSNQIDDSYALTSNLTHENCFFYIKVKNALIKGDNRYNDPASNISSLNKFNQSINEIELKKPFGRLFEAVLGIGYTYDMAMSDNYTRNAERNRFSGYISVVNRLLNSRLTLVASARDELVDGSFIPAVFSTGAEFQVVDSLKLKASAASSYRLPTMNDLYWANTTYAAGNPDLKPEYGWNADMGAEMVFRTDPLTFSVNSSAFISEINDWIVWLPDSDDNGRWKPNNLNRGKSTGIENFIRVTSNVGSLRILADASYTYTDSKMYDAGAYDGRPMIYIPRHRLGASLTLLYRGLTLSYNHSFTSSRYTDEQNKLPYYNLGDFSARFRFRMGNGKASLSIGVNNVWNEQYQLIRNFAMPLRNAFIRINYDFQSKSTK